MAKQKKRAAPQKPVNIDSLLWLGLIIIVITVSLGSLFPNIPSGITTMLYVIGILALIIYMWQIMYEKRTGRSEKDGAPKNPISRKK